MCAHRFMWRKDLLNHSMIHLLNQNIDESSWNGFLKGSNTHLTYLSFMGKARENRCTKQSSVCMHIVLWVLSCVQIINRPSCTRSHSVPCYSAKVCMKWTFVISVTAVEESNNKHIEFLYGLNSTVATFFLMKHFSSHALLPTTLTPCEFLPREEIQNY